MKNSIITDEKEYKRFVEAMTFAAENGQLPILLEHEDPLTVTMKDLEEMAVKFKQETGLDIDFHIYTCDCCNKLHLNVLVDYLKEEYEEEGLHLVQ